MTHPHVMLYTWAGIVIVAGFSVLGDVFIARAMKQVGDVHELYQRDGLFAVVGRILSSVSFLFGVFCMAVAFFSLLFALSWGDMSLVAPAAASLTFIGNAFAGKVFLKEKVDGRRWIATTLVAAGVVLLAG